MNTTRSRSRSFDRRSSRRSYSRSRSPRNRNTEFLTNDNRHSRRNDNNNRSRNNQNNNNTNKFSDRELGLKYRWEKTVFVSNIPYDVKWPEMKDLFRNKIGEIHFCEIFERAGRSLGVGSIEFKQIEDAEKAVELMNQYDMGTRKISVRMDSDGSRTRKAKEMSKDFNKQQQHQHVNNYNDNNQQTTSLLSALNSTNLLAALGLSGTTTGLSSALQQQHQTSPVSPNSTSTSSTQNLLSLLTTLGGGGGVGGSNTNLNTSSNNNNSNGQSGNLLNQIAQQNNVEGSVTNRIFVASLDYRVDEHKIREVFNLAGKVQAVSLFKDRDGKSRGMSVVEYSTPTEALNAVLMFNNQVLNNRTMNVRFDTKPPKEDDGYHSSASKLPSMNFNIF